MRRNLILTALALLLLAGGSAGAQRVFPGWGSIPVHGLPIYFGEVYFRGGGGGPLLELTSPVPPHGIDVVYGPTTGGGVPPHGPPIYMPGPREDTAGGVLTPSLGVPTAVLYPDVSPQALLDAARRGEGWPWEAPAALRSKSMRDAGVTTAWQALEAYRRLFTALAQSSGAREWAQAQEAICAQALRALVDRAGGAEALSAAPLLWQAEGALRSLRGASAEGAATESRSEAPPADPAVWSIWALALGALQSPESAAALDQILGSHLTGTGCSRAREAVGRMPGGPRYLYGRDLRAGSAPLTAAAEKALVRCDPALVEKGLRPLLGQAEKMGFLLLEATSVDEGEAQMLFASSLDRNAAWCVTAFLREETRPPTKVQGTRAQLPPEAEDRIRELIGQATDAKPSGKPTLAGYLQVTTPGETALWKLQAGKWVAVGGG